MKRVWTPSWRNKFFNLGECYRTGDGVAQDSVEAVRLFKLAADQGFAEAENNLGCMYARGCGVEQDTAEAIRWLERAAAKGHEKANKYLSRLARLRSP